MEASTEWTYARLNDLVERLDRTLERLYQGESELRSEMRELRSEFSALRRDLRIATVLIMATIIGTGILT
jgi:hypothetical protein